MTEIKRTEIADLFVPILCGVFLLVFFLVAISEVGMDSIKNLMNQEDTELELHANETCKNTIYEEITETRGKCLCNVSVKIITKRITFFEPKTNVAYARTERFFFNEYNFDILNNLEKPIIDRDGNVFVSYYAFLDRTSENNWGEEQRMLKFITETINLLSKSPYDYNVTEYSYIEQPYCGKYEIVTTTKLRNYSYGEVTGERTFKCVK